MSGKKERQKRQERAQVKARNEAASVAELQQRGPSGFLMPWPDRATEAFDLDQDDGKVHVQRYHWAHLPSIATTLAEMVKVEVWRLASTCPTCKEQHTLTSTPPWVGPPRTRTTHVCHPAFSGCGQGFDLNEKGLTPHEASQ
jgi:hypothetical protein